MAAAGESGTVTRGRTDTEKSVARSEKSTTSSRRVGFTASVDVEKGQSQRRDNARDSTVSSASQRYSTVSEARSEVWAPSEYDDNEDAEDGAPQLSECAKLVGAPTDTRTAATSYHATDSPVSSGEVGRHRGTVFQQHSHAKKTPLPLRILGLGIGFCTVVLLWEATNYAMAKFVSPDKTLAVYFIATSISAVGLVLSHMYIQKLHRQRESTLCVSFVYALSTLFSAIGGWGALATTIRILVPERQRFGAFLAGGIVFLFGSVCYALYTKHNVLLDIASCATSLGLHESDDES